MRRFQKWTFFALLSIFIIAIILRLIKLYEFTIWGSDSGEHYFLLNQLNVQGNIQLDYNGWGLAYPYFPGMHLLSSGFTQLSGGSAFEGLIFIIPITAALSVLLIFCITHRIFRDARAGLVAAGVLAVVLPYVYTTSHPIPGSLGSVLLLTCIFLLLKTYDNTKFFIPLVLSTLVLIFTHHLSTYFLIISLIFMILSRELRHYSKARIRTQFDMGYLTFLINITLFYWLFYASSFRDAILSRGIPFPIWLLIPIANLMLVILNLAIYILRKFKCQFKLKH